jgi:hypothetical protein
MYTYFFRTKIWFNYLSLWGQLNIPLNIVQNNSLTPIYCTINNYIIQFSCPIKLGELKTPLESLNLPTEYTVKKVSGVSCQLCFTVLG